MGGRHDRIIVGHQKTSLAAAATGGEGASGGEVKPAHWGAKNETRVAHSKYVYHVGTRGAVCFIFVVGRAGLGHLGGNKSCCFCLAETETRSMCCPPQHDLATLSYKALISFHGQRVKRRVLASMAGTGSIILVIESVSSNFSIDGSDYKTNHLVSGWLVVQRLQSVVSGTPPVTPTMLPKPSFHQR